MPSIVIPALEAHNPSPELLGYFSAEIAAQTTLAERSNLSAACALALPPEVADAAYAAAVSIQHREPAPALSRVFDEARDWADFAPMHSRAAYAAAAFQALRPDLKARFLDWTARGEAA